MAQKEFLESKKGLFSCGHHQRQNTMMSSCSNRQQRKPPLPCKGPSTAPSKIPTLKKISELKRSSTRALNLPVLNLEKVRRNFLEQAELASYGGEGGFCLEPPKVNSARFVTEKHRSERRSLLSGSLTERGAPCELLAERRVCTSGILTDRSCRQSYEGKSVMSGSLTDRSCRESFGSSYGLSLSNYLRNSRDSPLRNSKESPFSAPTMPKIKLDDKTNGSCLHSESRKSRGDKTPKYHSSISLSTYLPTTNATLHASIGGHNCQNGALGAPKHSSLVGRSFLRSRDSSDSKCKGDVHSLHTGNGVDSTRSSASKSDFSSWDAKRLPIQLVNTLEEALEGVNQTGFSSLRPKKAPLPIGSMKDLSVARGNGKFSIAKPSVQMDKVKAQNVPQNQEDLSLDERATSRRASQKVLEYNKRETANGNKETVNKLQSKSLKVSPLKLSLGNTQITVPLGFGGNPTENVQTCRPFQALKDEASSCYALSDRGMLRKGSLALLSPRREKTSMSNASNQVSGAAMTPEMALKQYGSLLTGYEHNEVLSYTDIYCVGTECRKLQPSSTPGACNHGFDDERGDYIITEHDHIAYRFEILGLLGKGSFGQVVKCQDHKYNVLRAIKLVRNKKRFHQQALIEVKILQHLRDKFIHTYKAVFTALQK